MKSMPMLLASMAPMLGPMVPVLGQPTKVMTEGLGHGDRVLVYAHRRDGQGRETLLNLAGGQIPDGPHPVDLFGIDFVQAERTEGTSPLHVWLGF